MKLDFSARETPTGIHYRNDGYGIFRESHSQRQNGFGFFASQNTDLLFLFLSSSGTSLKRRESREMKKGISYMFVSPKGSEKKNKMVCASKTVSAVIVAHMQSPVLDRNIGLLHELVPSKRSIYVRTLFYNNHEEINENPSFQYSINRNLKIGS